MSNLSLGFKVPRNCGEQFRRALVELRAFDRARKIDSDEAHIYLPVSHLSNNDLFKLREVGNFELIKREFQLEQRKANPEELLGFRPSFEVVGDIAIVEPARAEEVAPALMSAYKNIKTVITPISDVEGEFRTRRFSHVAGERRTTTTHKEHGLRYRVDLETTYFTPRLGTERLRVAMRVRPSDVVLDMFAGVGPFSLLLAKRGAKVVAIDKNPIAVRYMRENALMNKLNIEILEGDAAKLALRYENMVDQVVMNLPHSASQFLVPAIRAIKIGGVIQFYTISSEDDLYRDVKIIEATAEQLDAAVDVLHKGVVRSYAPRRYSVVIEFRVMKLL